MLLIREIMYCKPGKVRPMVDKFLAMSKLNEKLGMGKMRVMTDFCAEREAGDLQDRGLIGAPLLECDEAGCQHGWAGVRRPRDGSAPA